MVELVLVLLVTVATLIMSSFVTLSNTTMESIPSKIWDFLTEFTAARPAARPAAPPGASGLPLSDPNAPGPICPPGDKDSAFAGPGAARSMAAKNAVWNRGI